MSDSGVVLDTPNGASFPASLSASNPAQMAFSPQMGLSALDGEGRVLYVLMSGLGDMSNVYVVALDAGDMAALGKLLDENHALCQELTVSCKELDEMVLAARAAGAVGAKMSGTGRGGLMLALTPTPEAQAAVAKALEKIAPQVWMTTFA